MSGPPRTILLLHGILLNRWILSPLARFLRSRGHRVINPSYPTTRRTIEEHAESFARLLDDERSRRPFESLDLVTHSLGGLVARRLLNHIGVPEARRMLMMVPPNRGSALGRRLRDRWVYRAIFGTRSGWQLGCTEEEVARICGFPTGIEVGILAGAPRWTLLQDFVDRPHDGVLSHAEMRLDSVPFATVPASHTWILFQADAWRQVASFVETGRFQP